jgi:prepilin-type N-terminal cleavage/methylation domain-containing protein
MLKGRSGFTIVELLVVIVVIAILAAITVVAYNGIQSRAENTKTITAVNAYKKAVLQYGIVNGSYPGGAWCLGDQYPVLGGTTAGCRRTNSVMANDYSAGIRDSFKPYLGNTLPMPSTQVLYNSSGIGSSGGIFYGPSWGPFTLNGSSVAMIEYFINDTTCPVGPVYSSTGYPDFTGSPVSRSEAISATASRCLMLFPATP